MKPLSWRAGLSVLAALMGGLIMSLCLAASPVAWTSPGSSPERAALAAPPAEITPIILPTLSTGGINPGAIPPIDLIAPGSTATPTAAPDTTVVINEDFSSCNPYDDGDLSAQCLGGEYVFRRNETAGTRAILYHGPYTDTVIEVDGRATTTAPTRYGVIFRLADGGSTYYLFGLQNDGKYGLVRFGDNKYTPLVPYTSSSAVRPGTATNHLKVINQGVQIALYVNDQWLETVDDRTLTTGNVGLFLEGDQPGAKAAFDNLRVSTINRPIEVPAPAAAGATAQPAPTQPAQPTAAPTQADTTLLANLTYDSCDPIQDSQVDARCENGEFLFTKKSQNDGQWIYYEPVYTDTIVEVDTRVVHDTPTLAYGLLLRLTPDSNQTYLFLLTSDRKFGLHRFERPDFTPLIADTASGAITTGTNHLKFIAQGSQLAVYVNNQFLGSVVDSHIAEGRVALYVESDEPDATVAFDNLRITQINHPLNIPSPGAVPTPTEPSASNGVSCDLNPGEAGLLVNNGLSDSMRFTIGGGDWGTHDYDIPGDGQWYLIHMPPGRYTYTAFVPGAGTAHGERYLYPEGVCRQIRFSP